MTPAPRLRGNPSDRHPISWRWHPAPYSQPVKSQSTSRARRVMRLGMPNLLRIWSQWVRTVLGDRTRRGAICRPVSPRQITADDLRLPFPLALNGNYSIRIDTDLVAPLFFRVVHGLIGVVQQFFQNHVRIRLRPLIQAGDPQADSHLQLRQDG